MSSMTLEQVIRLLTKKGVMPSRELRQKMADAIDAHLLSQDAKLKILRVKCSGTLANNLCPDHRDKQVGNPCLACTIEELQSRLAAAKAEIEQLQAGLTKHVNRVCELQDQLAVTNERLRECYIAWREDRRQPTRSPA